MPAAAFAKVSDRHRVAGDWRNHFDAGLSAYFREATGDLLDVLGYPD